MTWSGSRGLLPAPSPLRTVHASFPAYGSSPCKLLFYQKPVAGIVGIPHHLRNTHSEPSDMTYAMPGAAPATFVAVICFLRTQGSPKFLTIRHRPEVRTLSGRTMSQSVSASLQDGIRFFRHSFTRIPDSVPCGFTCPDIQGGDTGLPRSAPVTQR